MPAKPQFSYLTEATSFIEIWMNHLFPTLHQPSISIALAHEGNVIFQKAWGYANLENQEQATPNHIYRVASHSKSFTAFLVGKLVDDGLLKLDEPISTYLPWMTHNAAYAGITLRQILSHSTGTARDGNGGYWNCDNAFPSTDEVRTYFLTASPILETNTRFKYSNFAYGLITLVIEAVCQTTYAESMQSHLLGPLKLTRTGPDVPPPSSLACLGYSHPEEGQRYAFSPNLPAAGLAAATGFHSTPAELVRTFDACLLGNNILSRKIQKELMHPVWPESPDHPEQNWYCVGLMKVTHKKQTYFQHSGGYLGFLSRTTVHPRTKISLSICMNAADGITNGITKAILDILNFFEHERGTENPLQKFESPYYSPWGSFYLLAGKNGLTFTALTSQTPLDGSTILKPHSAETFTIHPADGYGSEGEIASFTFKNGVPATMQCGPSLMLTDRKAHQRKLAQISRS